MDRSRPRELPGYPISGSAIFGTCATVDCISSVEFSVPFRPLQEKRVFIKIFTYTPAGTR